MSMHLSLHLQTRRAFLPHQKLLLTMFAPLLCASKMLHSKSSHMPMLAPSLHTVQSLMLSIMAVMTCWGTSPFGGLTHTAPCAHLRKGRPSRAGMRWTRQLTYLCSLTSRAMLLLLAACAETSLHSCSTVPPWASPQIPPEQHMPTSIAWSTTTQNFMATARQAISNLWTQVPAALQHSLTLIIR